MFLSIILKGLSLGGIYFLVSFGVTLLYGVGGFPNLAIGPIGLTGAFLTTTLMRGDINVALAILAGMGSAVLLGIASQRFVVEPLHNSVGGGERGRIFVIYGTFGLCLLFPAVLLNIFPSTMMSMRFQKLGVYQIMGISITVYELMSFLIALLTFIITYIIFNKTLGGNRVRAVTQNPILSMVIGINIRRIYLIIAIISSVCAYIGAILWGEIFCLELGSGTFFTLYGFMIAVMGGLGSIYGAFVVSLALGIILSATSFLIGGIYEFIITTIILIIILIVKPMGLIPTRREV